MSKYMDAFKKLPRAAKWGLAALLAVGFYFAVIEKTLDRINVLNQRADDSEQKLASFAASSGPQKQALDTFTLGLRHFGNVEFPVDSSAGRQAAFNRAINKVLQDNKVSAKSREKAAPLGNGPLTTKLGNEVRVERIVRDIEFDATPETVAQVVSALERTPVVATVSRVQIHMVDSKDKSARMVHAAITAEAWQLTPKKG